MTIASEITNYANGLGDAYTAVNDMGGIIPTDKNMNNLDDAIRTIPQSGPTVDYGTITISDYTLSVAIYSSGTYNCSPVINDASKIEEFMSEHTQYWNAGHIPGGYVLTLVYGAPGHSTSWSFRDPTTYNYIGDMSEQDLIANGLTPNLTTGATSAEIALEITINTSGTQSSYQIKDYYEYMGLGFLGTTPGQHDVSNTVRIGGNTFLRDSIVNFSFGQDADFIPEYFLANASNFDSDITLPSGITEVPDYFLYSCTSFNSTVNLSTVTSIGKYFMRGCTSFNKPIDLTNVSRIGDYFLNQCAVFDQPIDISNVDTIGSSFLSGCAWFNQTLTFKNGASIGSSLLSSCSHYNKPVDLSNVAVSASSPNFASLLNGAVNFNSTVTLPATPFKVGGSFMNNCSAFNQPFDVSYITETSDGFMNSCSAFNQPLTFTRLKKMGRSFLYHLTAFDSTLSIPVVTNIDYRFLSDCTSFTQPLTLPSTMTTTVGAYVYAFQNMDNFVGPLRIEGSASVTTSNSTVLTTTRSNTPFYQTGVSITGPYRSRWLSLANKTSSPYRKLVNGGA